MAEFKRRTLVLSTGKQIKLFGSSFAISKTLEIGEGYAPNIFSSTAGQTVDNTDGKTSNLHQLSVEEMMELAD